MGTEGRNAVPEQKVLERMLRATLETICCRVKETLQCELEISGAPYLTTCTIERVWHTWFPWKKKHSSVVLRMRGGLLRGTNKPWTIHCDVFHKDIEHIAAAELGRLTEQIADVDFLITAQYEQT